MHDAQGSRWLSWLMALSRLTLRPYYSCKLLAPAGSSGGWVAPAARTHGDLRRATHMYSRSMNVSNYYSWLPSMHCKHGAQPIAMCATAVIDALCESRILFAQPSAANSASSPAFFPSFSVSGPVSPAPPAFGTAHRNTVSPPPPHHTRNQDQCAATYVVVGVGALERNGCVFRCWRLAKLFGLQAVEVQGKDGSGRPERTAVKGRGERTAVKGRGKAVGGPRGAGHLFGLEIGDLSELLGQPPLLLRPLLRTPDERYLAVVTL